ncbi:hypothetical protein D9M71_446070 [compost metagenome]
MRGQVLQAIGQFLTLGVFDVGLVQHHQHVFRHAFEEARQGVRAEPGAGGVVRVGDEDHAGIGVDGRQHGFEVMPPVLRRHHLALGADGLGGDRVDGEGVLAEHGVQAGSQVGAGHQIEDVVGAVAEGHLGRRHAAALGQLALQFEAVAVGIAGQFGQFGADRFEDLGAGAERVLVAGQLDDAGRVEIEFARQFVDRLAGNIGGQLLHARLGQGKEVARHI